MTVPMQFTCTNDSFIWMDLLLLPFVTKQLSFQCVHVTVARINNNIGISIYHSANAVACTNDSFI